MNYQEQKAKRAFEHYQKNIPLKKVYGVVEKNGKFLCLKHDENTKYKYSIAGGSVEDGEDVIEATKREILEEMNVYVEFVRSLGHAHWKTSWVYEGKAFDVDNDVEVVLTRFVKNGKNKKLGLDGEFKADMLGVVEISKKEMLENVAEFVQFGIKFAEN